jgi:hypothetical protein
LVIVIGNDPSLDAGEMMVSRLSSITFRPDPGFSPNETLVVPVNPDPVRVTTVPPALEPEEGEIPVGLGRGVSYRNTVADPVELPVWAGLMTDMDMVPAGFGGEMMMSWLSLTMFSPVPLILPNDTLVAPENPDPVTVTTVPPALEPEEGSIRVSSGTGNSNRYMVDGSCDTPVP